MPILLQLNEEWLVTDLKHALEEDQVIFGEEEINETMQSVFAFSAGDRYVALLHLCNPV